MQAMPSSMMKRMMKFTDAALLLVGLAVGTTGCATTGANKLPSKVAEGQSIVLKVAGVVGRGLPDSDETPSLLTEALCAGAAKRDGYEVRCYGDVREEIGDVGMSGRNLAEEAPVDNGVAEDAPPESDVDQVLDGVLKLDNGQYTLRVHIWDSKTGNDVARFDIVGSSVAELEADLNAKLGEAL